MRGGVLCPIGIKKIGEADRHRLFLNTRTGYWYMEFHSPKKLAALHRWLFGAVTGQRIDHINGNKQDNRLENLRLCTQQQNAINSKKRSGTQSKYRGVTKTTNSPTWTARACGRYLGTFKTEVAAAIVYDSYMALNYPEFARFNFRRFIK